MVSKDRVLAMMREGIRLEERVVLFHLEGSLRELAELQLEQEEYSYIRERLDHLRRETLEHNDLFKKASEEIQAEGNNEY